MMGLGAVEGRVYVRLRTWRDRNRGLDGWKRERARWRQAGHEKSDDGGVIGFIVLCSSDVGENAAMRCEMIMSKDWCERRYR